MSALAISEHFYVSGGTMPEDAASYVDRAADRHLLESLLSGKFCYVLNSRQMGKSSMCVRTKMQLEYQGVKTAFVDLTKIGGRNVTAEQWYAGLIVEVGRALGMKTELLDFWKDNNHLSPMQRFFGSLREVVLEKIKNPVVIFVDEIDSTRSLPFDTDEFFAGIRECYNRRVHDPVYGRLTFCLLGVAVPSDLIRNAQTTPFNVGERIYLKDFTLEEASALAKGLPGREALVHRIHYWSHGHPFLTQSLCTAIKNDLSIKTDADVDRLVSRELFEPKARETNINLADVGNRVLNGYAEGDDINKFRADILSAYDKAIRGKSELQDDESNRVTAVLKLSGLMRSEGKALKVRNPIYERVFGKEWIKENMPGQELRRQQRAFYIGVVRTALVAGVVVAIIGYLAIANRRLALFAEAQAREKSYQAYVATLNVMPIVYAQKNLQRMDALLTEHANEPWRGQEWFYWDRMAHQAKVESQAFGDNAGIVSYSPDGSEVAIPDHGRILFVSTKDGKLVRTIGKTEDERTFVSWLPDGNRIVSFSLGGEPGVVLDAHKGTPLYHLPNGFRPVNNSSSINPQGIGIGVVSANQFALFDYNSQKLTYLPKETGTTALTFAPNGKIIVKGAQMQTEHPIVRIVDARTNKTLREIHSRALYFPIRFCFLPDGNNVIVGTDLGRIAMIEVASGNILWERKVSKSSVGTLSISRDGRRLAFTTRDRTAHVYDISLSGAKPIRDFPEANSVMLLPDGKTLATNYWNIKLYNIDAVDASPRIKFGDGTQAFLVRQSSGDFISVLTAEEIRTYELVDGKLVFRKRGPLPGSFISSGSNGLMYLADDHGRLFLKDPFKEALSLQIPGEPTRPSMEVFGDSLVALTLDGKTIQLWDINAKKLVRTMRWPSLITGFSSDRQQRHLLVCDSKYRFGLVDIPTWTVAWNNFDKSAPEFSHQQGLQNLKFSRDGTLFVSASDDDTAALWDAQTGRRLATFRGHAQSVQDADISPDNSRVATVSDDETVRLWDAKTGLELTTLGESGNGVSTCCYTTDGKYLMTIAFDDVIRLWPVTLR